MTSFATLGPLEVRDSNGVLVDVPPGRPARLLSGLLLRANRSVGLAQLVELLWAERPPRSYLANLRSNLSRLRRLCGGTPIEWADGGYVLRVAPEEVDVCRFGRHIEIAAGSASIGEYEVAAEEYRTALAMYRGAPLGGVDAGPFDPDRARLAELRLQALEGLTDVELATGRHAIAIVRLRGLVREHVLREPLWTRLMTALALAGRTAEALQAFQDLRGELREELGVDPGPAPQRLHHALLRGEPPASVA